MSQPMSPHTALRSLPPAKEPSHTTVNHGVPNPQLPAKLKSKQARRDHPDVILSARLGSHPRTRGRRPRDVRPLIFSSSRQTVEHLALLRCPWNSGQLWLIPSPSAHNCRRSDSSVLNATPSRAETCGGTSAARANWVCSSVGPILDGPPRRCCRLRCLRCPPGSLPRTGRGQSGRGQSGRGQSGRDRDAAPAAATDGRCCCSRARQLLARAPAGSCFPEKAGGRATETPRHHGLDGASTHTARGQRGGREVKEWTRQGRGGVRATIHAC